MYIFFFLVQIFEFIKYFPPAQQKCKIMVTSVVGHVYGLDFQNGRVRDLADLFKVRKTHWRSRHDSYGSVKLLLPTECLLIAFLGKNCQNNRGLYKETPRY